MRALRARQLDAGLELIRGLARAVVHNGHERQAHGSQVFEPGLAWGPVAQGAVDEADDGRNHGFLQ